MVKGNYGAETIGIVNADELLGSSIGSNVRGLELSEDRIE